MTVQVGLCQTWSETPKTGFLTMRLICKLTYLRHQPCAFAFANTGKPHYMYNVPHYNVVSNTTTPCHGSQNDYFVICLLSVTSLENSFIYNTVCFYYSMDPKDSIIMMLTCNNIRCVQVITNFIHHNNR